MKPHPDCPTPSHEEKNGYKSAKQRHLVRNTLITLLAFIILSVAAVGVYIAHLIPNTPNIAGLTNKRIAEPSMLFSADGTQLATFSQRRQERVELSQVSSYVIQALVATEDHRFYDHHGVDIGRLLSAVFRTARGDTQGGSTITQQLARNIFPEEIGRSRTIERKLKEIITAIRIERAYSKDQILETYLNTVPFLYNVLGIEMAARTYYDKSAAELNVLESATLIGMLKGTSYYNPVLNPGRAMKRRNVVLGQMVKHGSLTQQDMQAMRDQPLQVKLNRPADAIGSAPHFAAYLRKWLIEWAEKNSYSLYADGLMVYTTIDDHLQQAATEAVEQQAQMLQNIADVEWGQSHVHVASHTPTDYAGLRKRTEPFRYFWNTRRGLLDAFIRETPEYRSAVAAGQREADVLAKLKSNDKFMHQLQVAKTRLQAGFVAMDPATGEVKAWVGSRDFDDDQFDHVAQAARQPGSTFKPLVYGAALEMGMQPNHAYQDVPVAIRSDDGSVWRPTDMSGASGRWMSMREGLMYSKNSITAQVYRDVGLPSIINLAQAAGINQSKLNAVPSLSLGTSPVTLLEMVTTYSTIARAGEYRMPLMVKRITDRKGNVLAEFNPPTSRAMSQETAVQLIDMMRGVVRQGTGQAVKTQFGILADVAGKTGTTQNNTDGWFILMHPNLVAGAWVGFNDSRVTMRSDYWGQGGHNAVLIVGDFFKDVLRSKLIDVKAQFPRPGPSLMVDATSDWMKPYDVASDQQPPNGYGVITRSNGETVAVIGPDGARTFVTPENNTSSQITASPGSSFGNIESSGDSGQAGESEPEPSTHNDRVTKQTDVNLW